MGVSPRFVATVISTLDIFIFLIHFVVIYFIDRHHNPAWGLPPSVFSLLLAIFGLISVWVPCDFMAIAMSCGCAFLGVLGLIGGIILICIHREYDFGDDTYIHATAFYIIF